MKVRMERRVSLKDRFEKYVSPEPMSGCWLWTGVANWAGYGRIQSGGKGGRFLTAHRVAYELYVGPIPEGMQLDHLCRVRSCVNPRHLEPVTARTNNLRSNCLSGINAKKTHCNRGHEYSEANTRRCTGRRYCRTCEAMREAQRLAAKANVVSATLSWK